MDASNTWWTKSLTQHDVDYLKQTKRFTFELMREEI